MKVEIVPSSWLRRHGTRLGAAIYTSGAVALQERLESLGERTVPLGTLTTGHQGGVYRPPIFQMQFSRNMVSSREHGVPFMTSTAMLLADLSHLPFVNKRVAYSKKFAVLRLHPEMTLISCSGTIGLVVYMREDMDGIWSSQDIIKVNPERKLVLPGYLFAFLSSKYGVQLLSSGAYGAIIQHIEREHIIDMPIPRLDRDVEARAHSLVDTAARCRSRSCALLQQAGDAVRSLLTRETGQTSRQPWTAVSSAQLQSRCDAYYFSAACEAARQAFDLAKVEEHRRLSDVAHVFIPGIFKRRYAGEPAHGVPYITGAEVFQLAPKSDRYLMHRIVADHQLAVSEGTILIQEAGQLGGLIGRSVMVGTYLDGFAVSNNMVRVKAHDRRDAGFLYALLSTDEGVTLVARESAGSSIPHMDAARLRNLRLPWPRSDKRLEIASLVDEAVHLRDLAAVEEDEARALVERAIEEAV